MADETILTYGLDGFDTTKPANNVVETKTEPLLPDVANERSIRDKARQALQANAAFLALPSPTNAQSLAQVKLLTREVNGLIRLLLSDLQDVSDT